MEYQEMTAEEFKGIYTNEKLRNEVANAHGCYGSDKNFKYYGTCTYPNNMRRAVSREQIEEARRLKEVARWETLKKNRNSLLFVGMGMNYDPRYEGDVCNHRIRTEFLNDSGQLIFVEFGTGRGEEMRCDHSIDRNLERKYDEKRAYYSKLQYQLKTNGGSMSELQEIRQEFRKWSAQPFYNHKGLERRSSMPKYTNENVLKLVNETFGCSFKKMVVDHYNLSCSGIMCVSPGFELAEAATS